MTPQNKEVPVLIPLIRLVLPRRHGDGGYSSETIAVTALLVILAMGAVALISDAVLEWAGSIDLGT